MPKKNRKDHGEIFQKFDPQIDKLAMERFLSGKQLYDYRTKRLHQYIRDDVQARGILLRAQALAGEMGKELVLRSKEKQLLEKTIKIAVLAIGFCFLANLADQDGDGIEDTIEFLVQSISQAWY